jgi:hypothetical protein
MKETTVNSLVVARTLFEQAAALCASDDRHLASAGLVVLQDALELGFYALLIERGVDESKNLETKSFDELVGELKKAGVQVPKSGTLKALNKQRVLTKHYAQLAESATVRGYFDAARDALASVVVAVTGKPLSEIYMADLLEANETQKVLKEAEAFIASKQYLEALTAIRKAIFIEFEADYSVYDWRDYEGQEDPLGLGLLLGRRGWKAPYWTRRKDWIQKNVRDPLDYIQIDHDHWRLDATEWGISTADLQSICNLTPSVFRKDGNSNWSIKYDAALPTKGATPANAKYCLDRAIAVILKKREHGRAAKYSRFDRLVSLPEGYLGANVYESAALDSSVMHVISRDFEYNVAQIVNGFDSSQRFFRIFGASRQKNERGLPTQYVFGYLRIRDET